MPKGDFNAAKTHCPRGHPYDEANTIYRDGRRFCLECRRKYNREWLRAKRALAKSTVE